MSGPKPTCGYPSRTDAVLAFRKLGLSTEQIANKIGITAKIVLDLETSAARRKGGSVALDVSDMEELSRQARGRGIGAAELARRILKTVLHDRMVDAVLDDGGTAE